MGVGTGDGERFVAPRGRRLWLFARFSEPVPVEFYKWAGKVRFITLVVLLLANFVPGLQLDTIGYKADLYWSGIFTNLPVVGLAAFLGFLMWRGSYGASTLRRMNISCMLLEFASVVGLLYSLGTVTSHVLVFGVVMVFLYRVAFDFATGLIALVVVIVGQWAVLISQLSGWIASQPLLVEGGTRPQFAQRDIGAMVTVTWLLIVAFVAADWAVARLRHKELAIRILRETLAASETGKLGRHTGRALKNTYVVGALISAGGMGEVYRGHHRRTKRKVAIKILHPHLLEDELLLKRFRREAEITGQLGSPHIVEVVDVDRDDDAAFLVLELLHGEDLKGRIDQEGQLALSFVLDLVEQTCKGLAVAHDAGVVHRDLKPENLFLCEADAGVTLKILDFGVSKIRGNATAITQEVALLGTPDFMSPEQAMGQAMVIDLRTDVFALGCITYNAITGHRPFSATSVPALLRRICDEEPHPVSRWRKDAPDDISCVLQIAMAKEADQRFQNVSEFAAALSAACAGDLDSALRKRASKVRKGTPATTTAVGDADVSHAADTIAADEATDDTVSQS